MFKITVKENEKVLLYKDEKLTKVLGVGIHKGLFFLQNYHTEKYDFNLYGIEEAKAKRLFKMYPELIKEHFTVVELEANERAYIFIDGKFKELLYAGTTKLYWKEYDIKVEKVNIKENYKVDKKHIVYVDEVDSRMRIEKAIIDKSAKGYLYVNEEFVEELKSGKHYFYENFFNITIKTIDTRIKELEILGQELLTKDKVTIRCNLTMHYKIVEGENYLTTVDNPKEYLYKQLQFIIREHLGALSIDDVLSTQHTLSKEILEDFAKTCLAVGVKVEGVHIKDIILPGEMREIFNQVIEATKRAEANNIQRREETASTRSLLNTAKLMNDNPALIRLKELESLEKITQTIGTLNVYGGLDGVMNGLVDLKGGVKV